MFWSYRFADLDRDDDAQLIIKQLLSYGTLHHWRWMIREYGWKKISAVLSKTPESELRPSIVELSKVAFTISSMPHARRVPHTRS